MDNQKNNTRIVCGNLNKEIATNFVNIRKVSRYSQKDLSEKIGVSPQILYRLEKNKSPITIDDFEAYAKFANSDNIFYFERIIKIMQNAIKTPSQNNSQS